jgi:hypothetical protein
MPGLAGLVDGADYRRRFRENAEAAGFLRRNTDQRSPRPVHGGRASLGMGAPEDESLLPKMFRGDSLFGFLFMVWMRVPLFPISN